MKNELYQISGQDALKQLDSRADGLTDAEIRNASRNMDLTSWQRPERKVFCGFLRNSGKIFW